MAEWSKAVHSSAVPERMRVRIPRGALFRANFPRRAHPVRSTRGCNFTTKMCACQQEACLGSELFRSDDRRAEQVGTSRRASFSGRPSVATGVRNERSLHGAEIAQLECTHPNCRDSLSTVHSCSRSRFPSSRGLRPTNCCPTRRAAAADGRFCAESLCGAGNASCYFTFCCSVTRSFHGAGPQELSRNSRKETALAHSRSNGDDRGYFVC